MDERPVTKLWVSLDAARTHFVGDSVLMADFKDKMSPKFKEYVLNQVRAVEQQVDGKKQLFMPGSEGSTDLKRVLALCFDLKRRIDILPLFVAQSALSTSSSVRQELVRDAGGNSGVAHKLKGLREKGLREQAVAMFKKYPDTLANNSMLCARGRCSRASTSTCPPTAAPTCAASAASSAPPSPAPATAAAEAAAEAVAAARAAAAARGAGSVRRRRGDRPLRPRAASQRARTRGRR